MFDPRTDTHHHFIDDETGEIIDVPWEKVQVCNIESMRGYEISDYQVVMHGTRTPVARLRSRAVAQRSASTAKPRNRAT